MDDRQHVRAAGPVPRAGGTQRVTPSHSAVRRLSLAATAVTGALILLSYVAHPSVVAIAREAGREDLLPAASWPMFGLVALTFAVTGMVILRRTSNPVGWVMHGIGLCLSGMVGQILHILDSAGRDIGVGGRLLATWTEYAYLPGLVLMTTFLPLLFPTGRPPSRRWWWVACVGGTALVYGFAAVTWDALTRPLDEGTGGWPVVPVLAFAGAIGAALSVVARYRRAGDVERHQLKWVSAALVLVSVEVALALTPLTRDLLADRALTQVVLMGTMCLIPVSVAIAITRYHLYDIDRIISRTVSYALVALVLAAVYAGLVVVLGTTLGPRSDLTVAAATLAAATAFSPVRRHVQRAVDRRFNRPHYHAQREVTGFAHRLRGQVEMAAVSDDLVGVIDRTLQPSSVTLWIATGPR